MRQHLMCWGWKREQGRALVFLDRRNAAYVWYWRGRDPQRRPF